MKFRPQIQLRFRSEKQHDDAKEIASSSAPSLNEWILLQIEKLNPSLSEEVSKALPAPKKVKSKAKVKDAVNAAKSECPYCESNKVIPWGQGQHCNECKRNF